MASPRRASNARPARRAPRRRATGSFEIDSQTGANISNVAGDQINITHRPARLRPVSGFAKALLVLGVAAFLTGFGLFGYVVVRFIVTIFASFDDDTPDPPDLSFMLPWLPAGAGLAFVGIVLIASSGLSYGLRRGHSDDAQED
jgi:hypothetical protein